MRVTTAEVSQDFAAWIEPHQAMIARVVARLARPADRDDAYQRTLVAAWRYREGFDEERGSLPAWLATIAANEARRTWRIPATTTLPPGFEGVPHLELGSVERDLDLERCIRRLPERQRTAVHLYYFADLAIADVALVMDATEVSVKDLLFRARRRLAVLMGEH